MHSAHLRYITKSVIYAGDDSVEAPSLARAQLAAEGARASKLVHRTTQARKRPRSARQVDASLQRMRLLAMVGRSMSTSPTKCRRKSGLGSGNRPPGMPCCLWVREMS